MTEPQQVEQSNFHTAANLFQLGLYNGHWTSANECEIYSAAKVREPHYIAFDEPLVHGL